VPALARDQADQDARGAIRSHLSSLLGAAPAPSICFLVESTVSPAKSQLSNPSQEVRAPSVKQQQLGCAATHHECRMHGKLDSIKNIVDDADLIHHFVQHSEIRRQEAFDERKSMLTAGVLQS
jgi:hypothetical protein